MMTCHSSLLRALYLYKTGLLFSLCFFGFITHSFVPYLQLMEKNKEKEYFMCRVMRSPRPTLLLSLWPTCTWCFCPHRATKSRPRGDGRPPLTREAFYDLEIVSLQGNPNFGLLLKSFSVKSWKQVSDFGKSQWKIRATMVRGEAEIYHKKSLFYSCVIWKRKNDLWLNGIVYSAVVVCPSGNFICVCLQMMLFSSSLHPVTFRIHHSGSHPDLRHQHGQPAWAHGGGGVLPAIKKVFRCELWRRSGCYRLFVQ